MLYGKDVNPFLFRVNNNIKYLSIVNSIHNKKLFNMKIFEYIEIYF